MARLLPTVPRDAGDAFSDRLLAEPVDLASLEAAQEEKRQLLDRAAGAAQHLLTDGGELSAGIGPGDLAALLHRFSGG